MRAFVSPCLTLAVSLALACDKPSPKPEPSAVVVAADADEAADAAANTNAGEPPAGTPELEPARDPTAPAEPELEAESAPSFETEVATLAGDAAPTAEDEATAWTHYKAKDYASAQRHFARASLFERTQWKHPFNLACASALAKDEATTELALREALARDREAVTTKAARDGDLAVYRNTTWFTALLAEAPSPGTPSTDTPTENSEFVVAAVPNTPGGLPLGVNVPASAAQLSELDKQLTATLGLHPRILASLASVNGKGERSIYAVYDYSLFDHCVEVRGESQEECIERLGPGEDDNEEDFLMCTEQWFIRAEVHESALTLGDPEELEVACQITQLRLDQAEVDGDGKLETILDARGIVRRSGYRAADVFDAGRVVQVLQADGTLQVAFAMSWTTTDLDPPHEDSTRIRLREVNDDAHMDLVFESVWFMASSERKFDAELWPKGGAKRYGDRDIKREIWLYDVASDTWESPKPEPKSK